MTADSQRGDAVADKWRDTFTKNRKDTDLSLTRLEVRAEQRSEHGEEEDTGVIHLQAAQRVAERASESPSKPGVMVVALTAVRQLPPWGTVIVALAAIVAYVLLKLRGAVP